MDKDKLKQVYIDCIIAMGKGNECERVSDTEEGLDGCKGFGEPPWNTFEWGEQQKKKVAKELGEEFSESLKCVRSKAKKIVENQNKKRARMRKTDGVPKNKQNSGQTKK